MTRNIDTATLEDAIVRNGAPTLDGIKPASLFTFPGTFLAGADATDLERAAAHGRRVALLRAMARCRDRLKGTGVRLRVLVWRGCGALIYLYRPALLTAYLSDPRAAVPLQRAGYPVHDVSACLDLLAVRIALRGKHATIARGARADAERNRTVHGSATEAANAGTPCAQRCEFPHELGFFLGYPYADVTGFIEHGGKGFILMGPWKVYQDRAGALAQFERMRASTKRCSERYRHGTRLEELAARIA